MDIILAAWYFLYFVFLRSKGRLPLGSPALWWGIFVFFGTLIFSYSLYLVTISLGHANSTFGVLGIVFGLIGIVLLVLSKDRPHLLRAVPALWLLPATANGLQMGVWADETGNGGGGPGMPLFILFTGTSLLFALSTAANNEKTRDSKTVAREEGSEIIS